MKRWSIKLTLGCLLIAGTSPADQFPDPHGDDLGHAAAVAVGAAVSGGIEIDIDRDWFSFTAEKDTTYTIEVTPDGLWDAELAVYTYHGAVTLGATNSVGAATANIAWLNTAYEMTVYVDVAGFAKFTTGTYSLAVSAQPLLDTDGDGLPDAWETQYFTNATAASAAGDFDEDGFTQIEEYWLGTNPKDVLSGLIITNLNRTDGSNEVTWLSRQDLVYEVEALPALSLTNWAGVGTVLGAGPSTTLADPFGPNAFYRVRVKDVPDLQPDSPAGAAVLDGTAFGAIDLAGDTDWFRFVAEEDYTYTVRLTPSGGWDATLSLYALGGDYPLGSADALAGATVEIAWINTGYPEQVQVEVGGLGPSAMGGYMVELIGEPLVDTEPDGLPDAWEQTHFHSLAEGPDGDFDSDGFTNDEEKMLGSDPDDAASGLFVISLDLAGDSNAVTWLSAPLRRYEVEAAPSVDPDDWLTAGTATGMGSTVTLTEPGLATQRFYRVLFAP